MDDEQLIISTFKNKSVKDDFSVLVTKKKIQNRSYSFLAGQYYPTKMIYVPITEDEYDQKIRSLYQDINELFAKGHELEEQIKTIIGELKYDGA